MLYAGLDLSRKRLDVHVLRDDGTTALVTAVSPDASALRTLVRFITDRDGEMLELEADHRRHAEIENAIRRGSRTASGARAGSPGSAGRAGR